MAADGRIVIDVELNDGSVVQGTADISRQLDRMGDNSESVFKKVGNGFKTLAKAAAIGVGAVAGIGAAVVGLAKPLVEAAGAAQALHSQFEQVFEGMEDSATTALNKISAETSILPERLKGSFVQMAAFAKTTGMDTAKALSLTERATMAAADSAAFYDRSIEDVTESLQSFLKGNFENDAALGISATETTRNTAALAEYGKKFKDLSEEQKQFTLLKMVEEGNKLSGALGQASREGDGLENVVGNLKQAWENLKVKLGEPILDHAIVALKWLTQILSEFDVTPFVNAFNKIQPIVSNAISQVVSIVKTGISKLKQFWDDYGASIVSAVTTAFDTVKTYIQTAIDAIRDIWTNNGTSIIDAAKNIFESIKTMALPILEGAIETVKNIFGNVKAVWEQDGQAILERLSSIFGKIKDIVAPIIDDAVQLIITTFGKVKEFWDTNGQQIVQAVSNIFQGILAVVEFVMPAVKFVIDYVWTAIKNVITGALDVIMGAVKIFSGLFTGDFEKMWEGVKQLFSGAVDLILGIMSLTFIGGIRTALVNLGKTGISLIKGMWDDIAKLFTGAGSAITNTVSKMATSVVNFFKNIWTQGSNIFGTLKTFGANTFNALKQAVTTTVSGLVTSVVTFIRNLSTNFVNLIAKLKTSVVTKFNEIKNDVINKVKEIDLMQIGKDIVSGLINGVGAMFVNVKTKIEELASLIPDWAKKILGIHSPSRVMKQIGEWTGEGLAIGIDNTQSTVAKSMQDLGYLMLDVADHYADEQVKMQKQLGLDLAKANKESSEKITNIQSKANDKVAAIQTKASKKKRAISASEKAEIAKIEKNAANEISKIKSDAIEKNAKLESTASKNSIKALEEADKEYLATVQAFIDDKKSLDQLNIVEEGEIWKQSILLFDEGTTERIKAQQKYKAAVETVNKEVLSINSEYQAQMQQIDANYIAEAEKINKAYEDTFNARVATLLNFAGTFDEFKIELNRTGEELMTNLQGQVDGFKQWQEEFEKLSGRGIDSDLLEELSDLGVKALPELTALNSMTDEQLTKYSELYREKSQLAREQATKELEGMKKDTDQKLLDLRTASDAQLAKLQTEWDLRIKNLVRATDSELSTLQQVGVDAGQGLLDGLASMESPLIDKATQIAEAIKATIQSALDIHSPSRWMRDFVAGNLAKGFDVGVDKHLSIFKNAASNIGELIKPNIVNPLRGVKADLGTVATKSLSQINNSTHTNKIDNSRSFNYNIKTQAETASDYDRLMRRLQFESGL